MGTSGRRCGRTLMIYLPLHLVETEFILFLPGILQEKYPSSKPFKTGVLQPALQAPKACNFDHSKCWPRDTPGVSKNPMRCIPTIQSWRLLEFQSLEVCLSIKALTGKWNSPNIGGPPVTGTPAVSRTTIRNTTNKVYPISMFKN